MMRAGKFGLVALLAVLSLALVGCNKSEKISNDENIETENLAAVYCEENGGSYKLVTSETGEFGECTLADGTVCEEWDYYNGKCPEGLGNYEKSSLTSDDLESIDENNFPTSYSFSVYNSEDDSLVDEGEYTYPEDISHSLLIPEHATMASREVVSSNIQDEMIYTVTKNTLQDGTVLDVLYINDPNTLNYLAASVKNGDRVVNYQFAY